MRNKYNATCASCANTVVAGEGNCTKEGKKWVVLHEHCQPFSGKQTTYINGLGRASRYQ